MVVDRRGDAHDVRAKLAVVDRVSALPGSREILQELRGLRQRSRGIGTQRLREHALRDLRVVGEQRLSGRNAVRRRSGNVVHMRSDCVLLALYTVDVEKPARIDRIEDGEANSLSALFHQSLEERPRDIANAYLPDREPPLFPEPYPETELLRLGIAIDPAALHERHHNVVHRRLGDAHLTA